MKKSEFFSRIKFITIFGILGTLVNFFIVVGLTMLINNYNLIKITYDHKFPEKKGNIINLTISDILFFSATLCASDSVAALVII